MGCTVPKVVGDSVERNRIKRLIREAFRHTRERLPQGCVLVVNAKRSAAGMTLEDALGHFVDVAGRLDREGFRTCGT
ncbi:MAG: ribonuclease P protein component [Acidobacteria bacterium 37-65-4]|nr:MAG: ribonuclease P protein component [Acidobacteria bacterium 37-65-4]